MVNLEVFPLRPAAVERFFLVVFEEATPPPAPGRPQPRRARAPREALRQGPAIAELKGELAATKEYLQAVIEEQETSVEELKSTNEELMSANEELQSINEEMETSKEELQSTNEELATLNEELDNRNQELYQANNDLNNLLTAVQIAIVMLGPDLRIRRFNSTAQEMLNLIPADLGRPIGDLKLRVEVPDLEAVDPRGPGTSGHPGSWRCRPGGTLVSPCASGRTAPRTTRSTASSWPWWTSTT